MRFLPALLVLCLPSFIWADQLRIDPAREQMIYQLFMSEVPASTTGFNESRLKRQVLKLTRHLMRVTRRRAFIQQVTNSPACLKLESWDQDFKDYQDLKDQFLRQAVRTPALPIRLQADPDLTETLEERLETLADLLIYKTRLAQKQKAMGDLKEASTSVISSLRIISEVYFLAGKSLKRTQDHQAGLRAQAVSQKFWYRVWNDFAAFRATPASPLSTEQIAISVIEYLHDFSGEPLTALMSEERQKTCYLFGSETNASKADIF